MYKIEFKKLKLKLNRLNIERELTRNGYNEYDLAKYYITGFKKFNESIKSDLRTDDYNNSLITRIENGRILISDFGYKTGMNIYNYLIEKYYVNYKDAFFLVLDMIRRDFHLDEIESISNIGYKQNTPVKYNEIIKDSSLPVKIEVRRSKSWSKGDIEYWNSYGISIKKLEEKGIAPLDKFWITNYNKDGIRFQYNVENELAYVYPFFRNKDGFFMYKIYLPKGYKGNMDFKWVSNVNKKVIQNVEHIPKSGELLIIQSSYKDVMLMEELMPNLNILAPNGEGYFFDDEVWLELCENWNKIILFANNDSHKKNNPGLVFARRHSLKYKIPFICTPDNTASDISDYYKLYGRSKTLEFLDNCLENINLIT